MCSKKDMKSDDKIKLTNDEITKLRSLLVSWEDNNISDYEYCKKVGKILNLGLWSCKGYCENE